MQQFHGFYAPLEREIVRALALHPDRHGDFTYARRAHLLESDLMSLGYRSGDILNAPVCKTLAGPLAPETLGGVLYVIEGSILGATRIDRAAQRLLADDTELGRTFWAWCRANNGARWSMTLRYLDHLEATGADIDAVVAGATQTFQALADWLAPLSVTGVRL